jgi:hypothetical protein
MEEAPEKGKESSHSAYANGMNELVVTYTILQIMFVVHERTQNVACP